MTGLQQAAFSKLLTYSVLRPTQPPTLSQREMSSSLQSVVWRPNVADCGSGLSVVLHRGSNCSLLQSMDGHIMRHGIISSCQPAATSKTVKPTPTRRNCRVSSRRRRRCVHEFATTDNWQFGDANAQRSRRPWPSLQFCSQWHRITWRNIWRCMFVNFYNFLNNDVIMSSLVSTGNCKLGHDCRRMCSHRRRDETRQFRLVGGVYWA